MGSPPAPSLLSAAADAQFLSPLPQFASLIYMASICGGGQHGNGFEIHRNSDPGIRSAQSSIGERQRCEDQ